MTDCQICGTWRCAACGWKRSNANRFVLVNNATQACSKCGSTEGEMLPVGHRAQKARDHAEEYERLLATQGPPAYPLIPEMVS